MLLLCLLIRASLKILTRKIRAKGVECQRVDWCDILMASCSPAASIALISFISDKILRYSGKSVALP